jgi:predicted ATP-grasp superfamily ATP-dependent carboligase
VPLLDFSLARTPACTVGVLLSEMSRLTPAVVLSSHTAGIGVIRALGSKGVPVTCFYYESGDMGYVSRYIAKAIQAPHPELHEESFISSLVSLETNGIKPVLFPADDATLAAVARNHALLSEKFTVACMPWDAVEKFIDKSFTYTLAEQSGVPAPRTRPVNTAGDIPNAVKDIGLPCIVKPCQSHKYFELFRRKMVLVHSRIELDQACREALDNDLSLLIQEYIPGPDTLGVNYNSYIWANQTFAEFTARKRRLSPPAFGVPRVVVSDVVKEVLLPGRKILQALGFNGYSCVEFKLDQRDGVYKLMEVNGRHNRSTMLAVRCGMNFPFMEYEHRAWGKEPQSSDFEQGVYWIDEFHDAFQSPKALFGKNKSLGIGDFLRPYAAKKVFAVLDWKDMRPFFKRMCDIAGSIAGLKK